MRTLLPAIIVVASLVLGATVFRSEVASAAMQALTVFVTNDAAHAVPVTQQGTASVNVANTPTVSVSGTPSVRVTRQPFQQFVHSFAADAFSEGCDRVVVPAGTRLTIQAFSADVQTLANPPPSVFLRTGALTCCGSIAIRSLRLDLRSRNSTEWSGDLQTLLFSGATSDPQGLTYVYDACIADASGSFGGIVSGYLEPQ